MVLHHLQPSLNGGEISPSLYHRNDLQKFSTCVKKAKNMFVHPQGGMSNRAGTKMLGMANGEKVRLIPFEFSNTETYMIEFGDFYCRFYTTNGQIVNEDGETYHIESPFSANDLDKIRYCQSGDVMYIAWGGKPQTLTRYGHTDWKFSDYDYKKGPYDISVEEKVYLNKDVDDNIISVLLNFVDRNVTENDVNKLFEVETMISSQNFGGTVTSTAVAEEYKTHVFFVAGSYTVKTNGTWSGRFVLEISEDGITWQTKEEFSSYNDSNNYDFAGSFEGDPKFVRFNFDELASFSSTGLNFSFRTDSTKYNLNLRSNKKVDDYTLRCEVIDISVDIIDYISNSGDLIDYTMPILTSNTSSTDISITGNAADIDNAWKMMDGDDSTYMVARDVSKNITIYFRNDLVITGVNLLLEGYPSSSYPSINRTAKIGLSLLVNKQWQWKGYYVDEQQVKNRWYNIGFSGIRVEAIRLEFYHDDSYGAKIKTLQIVDPKTITTNPVYFNCYQGLWQKNHYPTEVDLYQDRVVWATNNQIDATKISDYINFGVSTEVTDDDAVSIIIKDKKINKINSAIAGSQLLVFTDSGNFIHNNDTFTPSSATFLNQGSTGGADVKPVIVRDNIIYVHPMKQAISDYAYSFETDGYAGQDITILANHLFDNKKIKELAYQQEPYSIIWVLQEEGSVLACTYLRQQNVVAWTPMDFGGKVLSIGVMSNGSNQELYLAVERKNGVFIEKMPTRLLSYNPEEQFFVDCGRSYRGEAASVIEGLDYLEGEEVVILADGQVQPRQIVQNGKITLKYPASVVHVGLPYESEIRSLPMDFMGGDGTSQDRKKRIVGATVFFINTVGGKIGTEGFEIDPVERVKPEAFNTPEPLRDFSQNINLAGIHEYAPSLVIKQSDPLPLTVTGWVTRIAPGG